jgi:endonuclease YncB( thermonuclease family)
VFVNAVLMATLADVAWENVTYESTVPYIPPVTAGKVVKVYDGDTITIATKMPGSDTMYRLSVRLAGIDCPEIKSKIASEKEVAQLAKQFVTTQVMGEIVSLENVKMEKYGRLLARVWYHDPFTLDPLCINDKLCEQRLAVAYDGGTKVSPSNWSTYYENKIE